MRKRILQLLIAFTLVGSLLYTLYLAYQPTPVPLVLIDYARVLSFDYNDVNDYIIEREGKHYLLFCDDSVDCKFVNDNMLRPLSKEVKEEDFPELIFVDMTQIRDDTSPARIFNSWGFINYPAFVTVEIVEKEKTILNVLEWSVSEPFGKAEIKQWMIDNEIWKGPIDVPANES